MNIKWFFEGGVPGESYGEGVRRRGKGMAVRIILVLMSAALVDIVFALFGLIWLAMAAAALCGAAYVKVGTPFDVPVTKPSRSLDKVIWLVLFTPPLLLLAGTSAYEAHMRAVFEAAALAGLFGAVLGGTIIVLSGGDSRAGVEGTTFTTSADKNP